MYYDFYIPSKTNAAKDSKKSGLCHIFALYLTSIFLSANIKEH